MAAIAHRIPALLFVCATLLAAEAPPTPLQVINRVATALADNDSGDAIRSFDKSFPDRETLRAYFDNLTSSYQISCEADVSDEQDTAEVAEFTFDWSLTLQNRTTDATVRRRQTVHVTLRRVKGEWSIVAFSPISLFTPQL